ncbi:MAG: tetratricopeptide repeat protein [Victivallales bacterium]|nr:tetratricopeptide repeat protein [Victivallales bacterium]
MIFAFCGGLVFAQSSLTPLEEYETFQKEREFVQRAQEYSDAGKYVNAAEQYRRAAKEVSSSEKRAGYLVREAENLLLGKKSHRAKKVYFDLVNNYRFFIPLHTILEQMRELADYFEHGTGTLLHLPDPGASIEIYREIVKCQPGGEQSLNDRLVLGKKLESDGQAEEAVKLYQETVKLLPKNPDVRLALAQCLSKLAAKSDGDGEISRAAIRETQSFLEYAAPNDPRRAEVTEILTTARNDEAKRLLERAEFYLVKYHYRPEVARRYLLDVLREFPDSPSAATAQSLVEQHFPDSPSEK